MPNQGPWASPSPYSPSIRPWNAPSQYPRTRYELTDDQLRQFAIQDEGLRAIKAAEDREREAAARRALGAIPTPGFKQNPYMSGGPPVRPQQEEVLGQVSAELPLQPNQYQSFLPQQQAGFQLPPQQQFNAPQTQQSSQPPQNEPELEDYGPYGPSAQPQVTTQETFRAASPKEEVKYGWEVPEGSTLDKLVGMRLKAPETFGKYAADTLAHRNIPYIFDPNSTIGGLEQKAHEWEAMGRGAFAGMQEGVGNVVSGLTNPLNLAAMALSGGAGTALRAGLPTISKALTWGSRLASAPIAARGFQNTFRNEDDYSLTDPSTYGDRAFALAELAGGAAGMAQPYARPSPYSANPRTSGPLGLNPTPPPAPPFTGRPTVGPFAPQPPSPRGTPPPINPKWDWFGDTLPPDPYTGPTAPTIHHTPTQEPPYTGPSFPLGTDNPPPPPDPTGPTIPGGRPTPPPTPPSEPRGMGDDIPGFTRGPDGRLRPTEPPSAPTGGTTPPPTPPPPSGPIASGRTGTPPPRRPSVATAPRTGEYLVPDNLRRSVKFEESHINPDQLGEAIGRVRAQGLDPAQFPDSRSLLDAARKYSPPSSGSVIAQPVPPELAGRVGFTASKIPPEALGRMIDDAERLGIDPKAYNNATTFGKAVFDKLTEQRAAAPVVEEPPIVSTVEPPPTPEPPAPPQTGPQNTTGLPAGVIRKLEKDARAAGLDPNNFKTYDELATALMSRPKPSTPQGKPTATAVEEPLVQTPEPPPTPPTPPPGDKKRKGKVGKKKKEETSLTQSLKASLYQQARDVGINPEDFGDDTDDLAEAIMRARPDKPPKKGGSFLGLDEPEPPEGGGGKKGGRKLKFLRDDEPDAQARAPGYGSAERAQLQLERVQAIIDNDTNAIARIENRLNEINRAEITGNTTAEARKPPDDNPIVKKAREFFKPANFLGDAHFVLPDGTLVNHGQWTHWAGAQSIGEELDNVLSSNIVRHGGAGSFEAHSPLTQEQADIIADDLNFGHRGEIHLDVFNDAGHYFSQRFSEKISSDAVRRWVNGKFRSPFENPISRISKEITDTENTMSIGGLSRLEKSTIKYVLEETDPTKIKENLEEARNLFNEIDQKYTPNDQEHVVVSGILKAAEHKNQFPKSKPTRRDDTAKISKGDEEPTPYVSPEPIEQVKVEDLPNSKVFFVYKLDDKLRKSGRILVGKLLPGNKAKLITEQTPNYINVESANLPEEIMILIQPKGNPGDVGYPLTNNDTDLAPDMSQFIKQYLSENVIKPGYEKWNAERGAEYDSRIPNQYGFVINEVGGRYTPNELQRFEHNPVVIGTAQVMKQVIDRLTVLFQHKMLGPAAKYGFLIERPDFGGLNVQRAKKDIPEFEILVSLIDSITQTAGNPFRASQRVISVLKHEFGHTMERDELKMPWILSEIDDTWSFREQADAAEAIFKLFSRDGKNYAPEVQTILQDYIRSRGRGISKLDVGSREIQRKEIGAGGSTGSLSNRGTNGEGTAYSQGPERPDDIIIYSPTPQAQVIITSRGYEFSHRTNDGAHVFRRISAAGGGGGGQPPRPPNRGGGFFEDEPPPHSDADNPMGGGGGRGGIPPGIPPTAGTGAAGGGGGEPPIYETLVGNQRPGRGNINPEPPPSFSEQAFQLPRSLLASMDMSAPLRQGLGLIHKKEFWKAIWPMIKSYGSERAYEEVMRSIRENPRTNALFGRRQGRRLPDGTRAQLPSFAEDAGLKLPDLLNSREEALASAWAETGGSIPGFSRAYRGTVGHMVRRGNRAYTAFLNKVRADTFASLVQDAQIVAGPQASTQQLALAKELAKFVNVATGRGDLGSLAQSAKTLNYLLFAPRLVAARLTQLNPNYYWSAPPQVRSEALKSLFAIAGFGNALGFLAGAAGAEVGSNPNSADFGKIRIGDTRIDPFGGFQQYVVAANRLLRPNWLAVGPGEGYGSGIAPVNTLMGFLGEGGQVSKSSTSGKEFDLWNPQTEFQPDQFEIIERFGRGKLNPVLGFAMSFLKNQKEMSGETMNFSTTNLAENAVAQRFIPIIIQDLYELSQKNPDLMPLLAPASFFGLSTQTYGEVGKHAADPWR